MARLAIDYLRRTAARLPDKTAVVDGDRAITFGELWSRALHLGVWIREQLGEDPRPVVIPLPLSIDAIVALTAIQVGGHIYVPLDVESPPARRERALDTLGPHAMLAPADDGFRLGDQPYEYAAPDAEALARLERRADDWLVRRSSTEPIYVIFTSGTTGVPKGVTISNASVIDYIDWAVDRFAITDREIIANQAPLHFDNSVLDIYLMLASGATLHLLDARHFLFLPQLVEYLRDQRVSFIYFVPSILANIAALDLLSKYELPDLKKLFFSGEPMPLGTLRYYREKQPGATLANLYGPTECTVDCLYHVFGNEIDTLEDVPLGGPCRNTTVFFLDEEGRIVEEPDRVAEICIGGAGVALGYWNAPEKTDAAFIQNPARTAYRDVIYKTGDLGYVGGDGLICMVGRKDDQIKHMGHRIEIGEIESAIQRVPFVTQCSVQYDKEHKAIVAFYASTDGDEHPELRKLLGDDLPRYMLPKHVVHVDEIPTLASGKIDRKTLWSRYEQERS